MISNYLECRGVSSDEQLALLLGGHHALQGGGVADLLHLEILLLVRLFTLLSHPPPLLLGLHKRPQA